MSQRRRCSLHSPGQTAAIIPYKDLFRIARLGRTCAHFGESGRRQCKWMTLAIDEVGKEIAEAAAAEVVGLFVKVLSRCGSSLRCGLS